VGASSVPFVYQQQQSHGEVGYMDHMTPFGTVKNQR